MNLPADSSGMEPRLSKGANPEIERWHQAHELYLAAQALLVRHQQLDAAEHLREALNLAPQHQEARQLLNTIEATLEAHAVVPAQSGQRPSPLGRNMLSALQVAVTITSAVIGTGAAAWSANGLLNALNLMDIFGQGGLWVPVVIVLGMFAGIFASYGVLMILIPRLHIAAIVPALVAAFIGGAIGGVVLPFVLIAALIILPIRSIASRLS